MSKLDDLRLLLRDTDPNNQLFTDSGLNSLLNMEGGDVKLAAALALETLAGELSRKAQRTRVHLVQVDYQNRAENLREMAAAWRADARRKPSAVMSRAQTPTGQDISDEIEYLRKLGEFNREVYLEEDD